MPNTTIVCPVSCTITVVHELSLPPLQLTNDDGGQIALAIIGVWVVGWAVRMVIRTMAAADSRVVDSE